MVGFPTKKDEEPKKGEDLFLVVGNDLCRTKQLVFGCDSTTLQDLECEVLFLFGMEYIVFPPKGLWLEVVLCFI